MKKINIQPHLPEILIFDEPEFCCSLNNNCPQLIGPLRCRRFGLLICITKKITNLGVQKHPDCKEAWKKAKEYEAEITEGQMIEYEQSTVQHHN
jgi:mannose-6-phosphate isomerase class I